MKFPVLEWPEYEKAYGDGATAKLNIRAGKA